MSAGKEIAYAGAGIALLAGVGYFVYKKWGLDGLDTAGCDTETGKPTALGKLIGKTGEECSQFSKSSYIERQESEIYNDYLWRSTDLARLRAAEKGQDPNTALVTLDVPFLRDPVIATTPISSQEYQQHKQEAQTWMPDASPTGDKGITAPFESKEYQQWAESHRVESAIEPTGFLSCPSGYQYNLLTGKCEAFSNPLLHVEAATIAEKISTWWGSIW